MRKAFVKALCEVAEKDPRVLLLTADLGYMALEPFAEKFPARYFNVGVSEQNMVGMATGLAEAGWRPFVYSIAPFAVLRAYEFIRNGPVYHHLPVRIVGMGGGLEYGNDGHSHYCLEDLAVMRAQRDIAIIAPADGAQTLTAMHATAHLNCPIYYRLGKNDLLEVPGLGGRFELGRVQTVHEGNDFLVLAVGSVASEAAQAVTDLAASGVHGTLGIVASVEPAPLADLCGMLSRFRTVHTLEAHYPSGGLGSLVAEVIAENGLDCRLVRHAVFMRPDGLTGGQPYLYERFGISSAALTRSIRERMAAPAKGDD